MSHTILATCWIHSPTAVIVAECPTALIGVIAIKTFEDEWKAFIGVGRGISPTVDEQRIASYGCALTAEQAAVFFPTLDAAKYKKEGAL